METVNLVTEILGTSKGGGQVEEEENTLERSVDERVETTWEELVLRNKVYLGNEDILRNLVLKSGNRDNYKTRRSRNNTLRLDTQHPTYRRRDQR